MEWIRGAEEEAAYFKMSRFQFPLSLPPSTHLLLKILRLTSHRLVKYVNKVIKRNYLQTKK